MAKLKCVTCGNEYEYCHACGNYDPYTLWRYRYCSEDCMNLLELTTEYYSGIYSDEEARAKLEKIKLPETHSFRPGIAEFVNKILGGNVND